MDLMSLTCVTPFCVPLKKEWQILLIFSNLSTKAKIKTYKRHFYHQINLIKLLVAFIFNWDNYNVIVISFLDGIKWSSNFELWNTQAEFLQKRFTCLWNQGSSLCAEVCFLPCKWTEKAVLLTFYIFSNIKTKQKNNHNTGDWGALFYIGCSLKDITAFLKQREMNTLLFACSIIISKFIFTSKIPGNKELPLSGIWKHY